MKLYTIAATLIMFLCGCAMTATRQSIAGVYSSNLVPAQVDARSLPYSTDLTLTLYADGKYRAWERMFSGGRYDRVSALTFYDLKGNSRGSWTVVDGRLLLRSIGTADGFQEARMRQDGRGLSIAPEESEASITSKDGHWIIVWNKTEYTFEEKAAEHSPEPALSAVH